MLESDHRTDAPQIVDRFHSGEQMLQRRFGTRDRLSTSQAIRTVLPTGFRNFLATLTYLVVGSADDRGNVWSSMLTGNTGFIQAIDPTHLRLTLPTESARPIAGFLRIDGAVALLAIDLAQRARIRINGRIVVVAADVVVIEVAQAFGNCPQYILPRVPDALSFAETGMSEAVNDSAQVQRIVQSADTFFIASTVTRADGVTDMDVSHRGGPAGFVRDHGGALIWPEYRGNFYFNTLGNLSLDPKCGLLIPDFNSGEMLMMTGTARLDGFDGQVRPNAEGLAQLGTVRFEPTHRMIRRQTSRWNITGRPAILPAF